ncbi:transposase, partial [Acetobacter oeni]
MNSKLHALCDGQGWPVRFHLTAGQVSDFRGADVLLADLPTETHEVLGDRDYDSDKIRHSLDEQNITACIPPGKNRRSKPFYSWHLYQKRLLAQRMSPEPSGQAVVALMSAVQQFVCAFRKRTGDMPIRFVKAFANA